jgi:hypothetical protein
MIICECGQRIKNIQELRNVKSTGFALYGECPKCNKVHPANTLWKLMEYGSYKVGHTYKPDPIRLTRELKSSIME